MSFCFTLQITRMDGPGGCHFRVSLPISTDAHFRSTRQFNWGGINFYPVPSVRLVIRTCPCRIRVIHRRYTCVKCTYDSLLTLPTDQYWYGTNETSENKNKIPGVLFENIRIVDFDHRSVFFISKLIVYPLYLK